MDHAWVTELSLSFLWHQKCRVVNGRKMDGWKAKQSRWRVSDALVNQFVRCVFVTCTFVLVVATYFQSPSSTRCSETSAVILGLFRCYLKTYVMKQIETRRRTTSHIRTSLLLIFLSFCHFLTPKISEYDFVIMIYISLICISMVIFYYALGPRL